MEGLFNRGQANVCQTEPNLVRWTVEDGQAAEFAPVLRLNAPQAATYAFSAKFSLASRLPPPPAPHPRVLEET